MIYTAKQAQEIIESIEQATYMPNEWEQNFLDSISDRTKTLTFKQSECLYQIYAKSNGQGIYQR